MSSKVTGLVDKYDLKSSTAARTKRTPSMLVFATYLSPMPAICSDNDGCAIESTRLSHELWLCARFL